MLVTGNCVLVSFLASASKGGYLYPLPLLLSNTITCICKFLRILLYWGSSTLLPSSYPLFFFDILCAFSPSFHSCKCKLLLLNFHFMEVFSSFNYWYMSEVSFFCQTSPRFCCSSEGVILNYYLYSRLRSTLEMVKFGLLFESYNEGFVDHCTCTFLGDFCKAIATKWVVTSTPPIVCICDMKQIEIVLRNEIEEAKFDFFFSIFRKFYVKYV